MGAIDIINGIMIYMYGFDHNPPHIHVMDGGDKFIAYIKTRVVEGRARTKTIRLIEQYLNDNESQLLEMWEKAQRGEEIKKIIR